MNLQMAVLASELLICFLIFILAIRLNVLSQYCPSMVQVGALLNANTSSNNTTDNVLMSYIDEIFEELDVITVKEEGVDNNLLTQICGDLNTRAFESQLKAC